MNRPTRPGSTSRVAIIQVQGSSRRQSRDSVATEEPLEIRIIPYGQPLPGHSVSVTMRTPGQDFELAAGFLYTEGILPDREGVKAISYCVNDGDGQQQYNIVNVFLRPGVPFDPSRLQRNFYMSSSCGVCGKASLDAVVVPVSIGPRPDVMKVSPETLCALPAALRGAQSLFEKTGGLHAAGLFDAAGKLHLVREDVGRHNAVDKLVGHALLHDVALGHSILVVSGRTSFEIIQKAAVAGIQMVVAIGAPSSLAIDLAERFGITLIGFLREDRFNVYAGAERVEG